MVSTKRLAFLGLLFAGVCLSSVLANSIKAAPYFMPLDNEPQDIDDIVANSGIRHFIFAFALATDQVRLSWKSPSNIYLKINLLLTNFLG